MSEHLLPPELRAEQGLVRALGREVLRSFPPVEFAFSYGSMVMKQSTDGKYHSTLPETLQKIDYTKGEDMMDFIFAVDQPMKWHHMNIENYKNGDHYSFLTRNFSLMRYYLDRNGPGMIFNPAVPIEIKDPMLRDAGVPEVINIKYGVTGMMTMMNDLINWNAIYVSGRLQKPVTILQANPMVTLASNLNLQSAVCMALLNLPPVFTELQLYKEIVSLSYEGDVRMSAGAEDPNKVEKLVMGSLPYMRDLYSDVLSFLVDGAFYDPKNELALNPGKAVPEILAVGESQLTQIPLCAERGTLYAQLCDMSPAAVVLTQPDTNRHRAMLAASLPCNLSAEHARRPGKLSNPLPPFINLVPYEPRTFTFGPSMVGTMMHQVSPYGEFDGRAMLAEQEMVHRGAATVPGAQKADIKATARIIDDGANVISPQPDAHAAAHAAIPHKPGRSTQRAARARSLSADTSAEPDADGQHEDKASENAENSGRRSGKSIVKKEAMQTFPSAQSEDAPAPAAVNSLEGTASFLADRELSPQERRAAEAEMRALAAKAGKLHAFYDPCPPARSSQRFDSLYTTVASDLLAIERALPSPTQHVMLVNGVTPDDVAVPAQPASLMLPTTVPVELSQALPARTATKVEGLPPLPPSGAAVGVRVVELPLQREEFFLPYSAHKTAKKTKPRTAEELEAATQAAVMRTLAPPSNANDAAQLPGAAAPAALPAPGAPAEAAPATSAAASSAGASGEAGATGLATVPDKKQVIAQLMQHVRRVQHAPVVLGAEAKLGKDAAISSTGMVATVPREQLLKDPWAADRASFPALHSKVDKHHEENKLIEQKALPDVLALPKIEHPRQRWQVDSRLTKEQIDAEIKALGREPTESELKALHSPFINVKPAIYDPRESFGGVARFDNAVRSVQVVLASKFPLFGAALVRYNEKKNASLWKHDLNRSSVTQRLLRNKIFTDTKGISHVGQLTKNFEYVFASSEWEATLKTLGKDKVIGLLRNQARKIVAKHSKEQAQNGFWSAGLKGLKYALNKLKKGGRFR